MKLVDDGALNRFLENIKTLFATVAQGKKADTAVQSVKIGSTEYKSGTNVVLPAYPTTLPASDVSEWAKKTTKPTYTASEVGAEANGTAALHVTSHNNDPFAHNIDVLQMQVDNLAVELTQAEYNALVAAGETDPDTVYYITDVNIGEGGSGGSGASNAKELLYNNTESGLESTNVQDAIDEVNNSVASFVKKITFTRTTSVAGNINVADIIDTTKNLPLVCYITSADGTVTYVGIIYTYSYRYGKSPCGIHVISENDNSQVINTDVECTLFYVPYN